MDGQDITLVHQLAIQFTTHIHIRTHTPSRMKKQARLHSSTLALVPFPICSFLAWTVAFVSTSIYDILFPHARMLSSALASCSSSGYLMFGLTFAHHTPHTHPPHSYSHFTSRKQRIKKRKKKRRQLYNLSPYISFFFSSSSVLPFFCDATTIWTTTDTHSHARTHLTERTVLPHFSCHIFSYCCG